ncbi:D-glycero-beta-D-manno-heptose 1,7-bisphosphate 7-phosphatase [Marinobacter nanhaiticus D15-8W]|uniref:D,D-heptose 1,7-bisphosphate phosphatase n=1 Tax=Marinobacter nanhaiticus D15-8W TaxID=626887 RepID=N6X2L5_9GAMM|nr:D-glycero-beta-D-manno-heptose 1,7-bisphosphate 7-phosphatase [Marinobacter nanhaiticus]ENO15308.1 D-glycero-beta-D-manno-heptose 1,7-bisphosphate 7-phosphatase [Marinobacter nanhaiticus D15-8W]BES68989.1 D-glycero-beta-D-manno-heptose 1,7-bisphosphate 7-phosphatase [Marinobacter nanhaiticus D15-8W]
MLVILDRDGVINRYSGEYICSVEEWLPIASSIEAMARLTQAGHQVAVATNQSGIARGYYDHLILNQMHAQLHRLVEALGGKVDCITYCPHHPDEDCQCRKPRTGLLEDIRQQLGLADLSDAVMVGDSLKDLEAGLAASCRAAALVRTGNGKETELYLKEHPLERVSVWDNLADYVAHLLDNEAAEKAR